MAFGVRFYLDSDRAGPLFKRGVMRQGDRIRKATREAAKDAANQIEILGRSDISRAGNFGSRWTEGFQVKVTEGGGNVRIAAGFVPPAPSFAMIHETGGTIFGKPLLFIPMDWAPEARGVSARDYPGPLFRVDRKSDGLPLLFSAADRQVKYVGKEQVTLKPRFHLTQVVRDIAQRMADIYRGHFSNEG